MESLEQYIQLPQIQQVFADLTNKYLESEPGLLQEIAERVISGEVPMDEVLILLLEETDLELEQATQLNNELFDRVWSEKYDELNRQADNYSPINYMLKAGEEIESEPLNALKDLVAEFYNSPEVESVASSLKEHINNDDQDKTKEAFYGAINKKEKQGFINSLAVLFSSGKLKELFKTDERYIAFWRPHILREHGLEQVHRFDENPAHPRYFGPFIKYVLEHRYETEEDQSVLWGVYLSSLAHNAGDKEYEKLAYGDMKEGKFHWSY